MVHRPALTRYRPWLTPRWRRSPGRPLRGPVDPATAECGAPATRLPARSPAHLPNGLPPRSAGHGTTARARTGGWTRHDAPREERAGPRGPSHVRMRCSRHPVSGPIPSPSAKRAPARSAGHGTTARARTGGWTRPASERFTAWRLGIFEGAVSRDTRKAVADARGQRPIPRRGRIHPTGAVCPPARVRATLVVSRTTRTSRRADDGKSSFNGVFATINFW